MNAVMGFLGPMAPHERLVALCNALGIPPATLKSGLNASNTRVSNMLHGRRAVDDYATLSALSKFFRIDIDDLAAYLFDGSFTPEEMVRRRGQQRAAPPSNLEVAILYLREILSDEAIEHVRQIAPAMPDRSPMQWGRELAAAQASVVAAKASAIM